MLFALLMAALPLASLSDKSVMGWSAKLESSSPLLSNRTSSRSNINLPCGSIRISESYIPVCAKNGLTYRNFGQLACIFNQTLDHEGPCDGVPGCPPITAFAPICGADGKTYANEEQLACAAMSKFSNGPCGSFEKPDCSAIDCAAFGKREVCGNDLNTYDNSCALYCAGKTMRHNKPCKGRCTCAKEYKPVCGANNVTYSNMCMIKCSKIEPAYEGSCKAQAALAQTNHTAAANTTAQTTTISTVTVTTQQPKADVTKTVVAPQIPQTDKSAQTTQTVETTQTTVTTQTAATAQTVDASQPAPASATS